MIFFKLSGERISPLALNLFKNAVGLLLLLVTLLALWVLGLQDWIGTLSEHPWEEIGILLISGFIGIAVADTVFFHALNRIGVGIIAIVDCLYSPSIIFFSFIMLSETLGPFQYAGGAMILLAVLVAARLKPPPDRTHAQLISGILLGALSMVLMAFGIVLAKPVLNDFPLIWATTLRMLAGTLSLAVLALASSRRRVIWSAFRPSSVWKWSMPGAILGAYVSMILWVAGFKYLDASLASILNQTSTVFAIILATLILKEEFNLRKLLAVVLAMAGIVLVACNSHLSSWLNGSPPL
jgi:drug/metabolite transporter (DMT)-like permease